MSKNYRNNRVNRKRLEKCEKQVKGYKFRKRVYILAAIGIITVANVMGWFSKATAPVEKSENYDSPMKTYQIALRKNYLISDNRISKEDKIKVLETFFTLSEKEYEFINFADLTTTSGLSEQQFEDLLPDNQKDLAKSLYYAENRKDGKRLNGLFIIALMKQESTDGKSRIAREKNNLFGLGAYDDTPYMSAFTFNSKDECIDYLCRLLHKSYFTVDGKYTEALAYVNKTYCSKPSWTPSIMTIAIKLNEKAKWVTGMNTESGR